MHVRLMCLFPQWHGCPHGGVTAQAVPAGAAWACGALDSVPRLPGLHQHAGHQQLRGTVDLFSKFLQCVWIFHCVRTLCVYEEVVLWYVKCVCPLISRLGLGQAGQTDCSPPQNQLQPSQLCLPVSRESRQSTFSVIVITNKAFFSVVAFIYVDDTNKMKETCCPNKKNRTTNTLREGCGSPFVKERWWQCSLKKIIIKIVRRNHEIKRQNCEKKVLTCDRDFLFHNFNFLFHYFYYFILSKSGTMGETKGDAL